MGLELFSRISVFFVNSTDILNIMYQMFVIFNYAMLLLVLSLSFDFFLLLLLMFYKSGE